MKIRAILVDRRQFVAWLDGVILDRNAGIVPNEIQCEAAMTALERGEPVLFTQDGRLTGTGMRDVDGVYMEVEVGDQ